MYLLDFILGLVLEPIIWVQEVWIRFQMKRIEKKLNRIESLLNPIPEEEKEEE